MRSVSTNPKPWKSIIGLSSIAILSCGVCCLPLIAPIVASTGAALGLGACFDELSYGHLLVLAGLALTVYFVIRWRQKKKAKACQQVCQCEHTCETIEHIGET